MAAVLLLRLAESLLLKTASTYLSEFLLLTPLTTTLLFIVLDCNQTIRAYHLASYSSARELCI